MKYRPIAGRGTSPGHFLSAPSSPGPTGPGPSRPEGPRQSYDPIGDASRYLRARLQRASLILYRLDGLNLYRLPGKIRGNRAYAYAMRGRLEGIQRTLDGLVQVDQANTRTNAAFVTLTVRNQGGTLAELGADWRAASKDRSRFFQWARRTLGASSYVYSVESTAAGGYHVHAVLVFPELRECKRLYSKKEAKWIWRFPRLNAQIRAEWGSNVDVRGVESDTVAGYLTKELHKMKASERALQAFDCGRELDPWERKSILTFTLGAIAGCRLFGTSRDIKFTDAPEEGVEEGLYDEIAAELGGDPDVGDTCGHLGDDPDGSGQNLLKPAEPAASIPKENNLTADPSDPLALASSQTRREALLTRLQLERLLGERPPPYTGLVDPESREYQIITEAILGFPVTWLLYPPGTIDTPINRDIIHA